jgi:hypothetical protein
LTFASGFTAQVSSAVFYDLGTTTVIVGDAGRIVLGDPWIPMGNRQGLESQFTVHRDGEKEELVTVRTERATYALEAELVADSVPATQAPWPAMTWADTLGNLRVMDAWRAALASR